MMYSKPFVHLFTTPGGFYIYDVNTDMILKTGENVYSYLKHECESDVDGLYNENANPIVEQMIDDGFLSSKRVTQVCHPATDFLELYLKSKLNMITLQVTQNCNLRCDYCAFSGKYGNRTHSNKTMDFETAKKGIDFLINHSMDKNQVNVGFYGGEPLLIFDLIRDCVNYAEEAAEGKEIHFNLTSNGTLLNEKIVEFFISHNIKLTLSIDGPREIQNKNRKFAKSDIGSFDVLYKKINMIKENYADYYKKNVGFNMVLDPAVDFSCVNNFIINDDIFDDPFLSASVISKRYLKDKYEFTDVFVEKRNYELFKLFLNKLNQLDDKLISPLMKKQYDFITQSRYQKQRTARQILPDRDHHGGPCIPGALRLFLSTDGIFYPCERVSEESEVMRIGTLGTGIDTQKAEKLLNIGRITAEQCKNCWAFRYCTVCAGSADNLNELSPELVLKGCPSVRGGTESMLKDYCVLKEFGDDFSDGFAAYE